MQGRVGAALALDYAVAFFATRSSPPAGCSLTFRRSACAAARDIQADLAVTDYPANLFVIPRKFDVPAAIWIFEMVAASGRRAVDFASADSGPATEPGHFAHRTLLHSRWTWYTAGVICILARSIGPGWCRANRSSWYIGLIAGAAVAAASLLLRRRSQPYVLAAIAGGGLFACMLLFHGSTAWWDCAVHYGSIHWPYMFIGPTSNVPAVFQLRFGWHRAVDQIAFTLPAIHGPLAWLHYQQILVAGF